MCVCGFRRAPARASLSVVRFKLQGVLVLCSTYIGHMTHVGPLYVWLVLDVPEVSPLAVGELDTRSTCGQWLVSGQRSRDPRTGHYV